MKALLIDDNPDDRALVLRELRKDLAMLEPVHVIDALDFEAALESGDFALVVTDYQLRWTNGLQVLSRIRERYENVAIVMFTGTGNETVAVEAMRAGVDDYVVKSADQLSRLRMSLSTAMIRAAQRAATRDQNARMRAILETIAEGILITDADGWIEAGNPAVERILGCAAADLQGRRIHQVLQLPGMEGAEDPTKNSGARLDFLVGVGLQEALATMPDGTSLPVELSVSAAQLTERRIFTLVLRDIAGRKREEAKMLRALDDAREANTAKSAFLANMSHELRTPLNAILGFSSVIREQTFGPLNEPHYAGYIDDIYFSAEHLLSMINDMLDMAKVQAGHFELQIEPVDIDACVIRCIRMLDQALREARHDLAVDLPKTGQMVQIDARVLRQVVLNLLSNAIKYTAPGGLISLSVKAGATDLLIVVADNGDGIRPEHLARIGEPFLQFSDVMSRRQGGSGLGLALIKLLIERHQGHLAIESQLSVGTTVTVTLPTNL
jgi:PAS domain S-box-containing protein